MATSFIDPEERGFTSAQINSEFRDPETMDRDMPVQGSQEPSLARQAMEGAKNFGIGVGHGVQNVGEGVAQLGVSIADKFGLLPEGQSPEGFTRHVQEERRHREAGREGMAYSAGRLVGEVAPYAAIPGGTIARGAMGGAAIGATQFVPEGESRTKNALLGSMLGGSLPALFKGVQKGAPILKSVVQERLPAGITEATAQRRAASMLSEVMTPAGRKAALLARKEKLALSPGAAEGSKSLLAREGRLPVTEAQQRQLEGILQSNAEKVGQKVTKLFADDDLLSSKYARKLENITPTKGNEAPTVSQIHNKLFGNVAKQKEVLSDIAKVGGDVDQAKNLMTLTGKLKASQLDRLVTKAARDANTTKYRGLLYTISDKADEAMQGKVYDAYFDLMTNPKWDTAIKKILDMPTRKAAKAAAQRKESTKKVMNEFKELFQKALIVETTDAN